MMEDRLPEVWFRESRSGLRLTVQFAWLQWSCRHFILTSGFYRIADDT
jgi:hypothetical protein